jgi:hypothetical protein
MRVETEKVGMLSLTLEAMEYAGILRLEKSNTEEANERKRAVPDGEFVERRPENKRPTLKSACRRSSEEGTACSVSICQESDRSLLRRGTEEGAPILKKKKDGIGGVEAGGRR